MPDAQRKLGPYTLIRKIGRGAFGVVWLAEKQTSIATTSFALKLPRDEDIDLEVFKQEASIWVQASGHTNVVALIEADTYDDQLVLVSEYVPDGSLGTWLKQYGGKAPSLEAACEMIEGILSGLAHLHDRHIIHRDLKPDNILLQSETPRLADFGIARLLRSGSYSTNISGTLAYMAPEVFDGKRNEQTDIWSVGVILYQLLDGRLPYAQTDTVSFIGAIMRADPPPLDVSCPESFRRIVAKALQRNPEERYRSAKEMRIDLRAAERGLWAKGNQREEFDDEATVVGVETKQPLDPTIKAQFPQPLIKDVEDQRPPDPTIKYDPAIEVPPRPQPEPQPYSVPPRKSRTKVWLSAGGSLLLTLIFLGVRIIPHFLSPSNSSASNANPSSGQPATSLDRPDLNRWLAMLSQSEHVDQVIEETTAALKLFPDSMPTIRVRASAYSLVYNDEASKNDLERVDAMTPTDAPAFEARCFARLRLHKEDEALPDCSQAILLDPTYVWAWNTRGSLYQYKREYTLAISDFTRGIELKATPMAYINRGTTFDDSGNFRRGLLDLNKAVELAPKFPAAFAYRGIHYYRLKDYERALSDYDTAIELDSNNAGNYLNRGNVYYLKKDFDKALKDYDLSIQLDSKNPNPFLFRADIYVSRGDYDKAMVDYAKAIELDDKNGEGYLGRGICYHYKHDYEHAILDYNRASELTPKNPLVFNNRGLALYSQGRYDLAIADYSHAIALSPRYIDAYKNRANAYDAKGQSISAFADRNKVQELGGTP